MNNILIVDYNPTVDDLLEAVIAQVNQGAYKPTAAIVAAKWRRLPRKLKKRLNTEQRKHELNRTWL